MNKHIDAMKNSMTTRTEVQQKGRRQRPRKEERVKTTVYLPISLWIALGDLSRRERTSANHVIVRAVENMLRSKPEDKVVES